jgi:hypothetical protein
MPRPLHFELVVSDPEKTGKFYKEVFGWKIEKWNGPMEYWMVSTEKGREKGINGGITKKGPVQQPVVNTVMVSSVDNFHAKIKAAGGSIVTPKGPIPGMGWFSYCKDPEGIVFGIMQADKKAK